jgi:hypothetical protein
MKNLFLTLPLIFLTVLGFSQKRSSPQLYELRVYHCEPGKLADLENRFKNHTMDLFEKHGMINIAYWKPTKEGNNSLYYLLAYNNKEKRDLSWKNFMADPEWQSVMKKSEENGKIISKIESIFLKVNPELSKNGFSTLRSKSKTADNVFEMRTYHILPGRYPNIVARFRDHTRKLFSKQGMMNVIYFDTIEKDGEQPKLLYFLQHKSEEAAKKSWDGFRNDPKWLKARDASEASGKIVEKVESVMLKTTEYSRAMN